VFDPLDNKIKKLISRIRRRWSRLFMVNRKANASRGVFSVSCRAKSIVLEE